MADMKHPQIYASAARLLRAVAHPVRLEILTCLIRKKRMSVGELQEALAISQSMTSQHLASLKNAGVVNCLKKGNLCHYHIQNPEALKLLECIERCVRRDQT